MDFTEIFGGESLTLEQFTERTKEMNLVNLKDGGYVSEAKYNDKLGKANERAEKAEKTLKELQESMDDVEDMKVKLEEYQKADEARQKAEQEAAAHAALVERFNKVKGEKQFSSQFAESGVLDAFAKAISDPANTGKGDNELFEALTKDAAGIWKNPQQETVKIEGVTGNWTQSDETERMMRKVMGLPIAKGE